MGYFAEVNTLLRLPKDHGIDLNRIAPGRIYEVAKDNERIFPLNCAILLEDDKGEFWGYCMARSVTVEGGKTKVRFEIATAFSKEERKIYSGNFDKAARFSGEIK